MLCTPLYSYALDALKFLTNGETTELGSGGIPLPSEYHSEENNFFHPAYFSVSPDFVLWGLDQQNTARINGGNYKGTVIWDTHWAFSGFYKGLASSFQLDRSYAHLRSKKQNIDGLYRSQYSKFNLGYGLNFRYLMAGISYEWIDFNDSVERGFNYEIVAIPFEWLNVGYRKYSTNFHLDISAFVLDEKLILPIAYTKTIRELDFCLSILDALSIIILWNLNEEKDRNYIFIFSDREYGNLEIQFLSRKDRLEEVLINAEEQQLAHLDLELYQNHASIHYLFPFRGGKLLATFRRMWLRTDDYGSSEGEYIQMKYMNLKQDLFDFDATANLYVVVDSYALGWRSYGYKFDYQLGIQYTTIENQNGGYSYRVTFENGNELYSDSDILDFDKLEMIAFTGGIDYKIYDNLYFRYALVQYLPRVDVPDESKDRKDEEGEKRKKKKLSWWEQIYQTFISMCNAAKKYQGGNSHRLEIVWYF